MSAIDRAVHVLSSWLLDWSESLLWDRCLPLPCWGEEGPIFFPCQMPGSMIPEKSIYNGRKNVDIFFKHHKTLLNLHFQSSGDIMGSKLCFFFVSTLSKMFLKFLRRNKNETVFISLWSWWEFRLKSDFWNCKSEHSVRHFGDVFWNSRKGHIAKKDKNLRSRRLVYVLSL